MMQDWCGSISCWPAEHYRKRALLTLLLTIPDLVPAFSGFPPNSRIGRPNCDANLAATAARGDLNDPGPHRWRP